MNKLMCPMCGREMVEETRPQVFTYKGRSVTLNLHGLYCECGEGIHTGKELAAANYDKEINRLKALDEGLLLPEEIRAIRKRLSLTQTEAGSILGGGPMAFHKYESGAGLPSHAISNLLRVLDHDAASLEIIRQNVARTEKGEMVNAG